jgi:hypothetical protein
MTTIFLKSKSALLHNLTQKSPKGTCDEEITVSFSGGHTTGSAIAQDRSRNAEPAANLLADQSDARTARMRADLRLS